MTSRSGALAVSDALVTAILESRNSAELSLVEQRDRLLRQLCSSSGAAAGTNIPGVIDDGESAVGEATDYFRLRSLNLEECPSGGEQYWDIELLAILLKFIFPSALFSSNHQQTHAKLSTVPNPRGLTGLPWATFLAKIRVFSRLESRRLTEELTKKMEGLSIVERSLLRSCVLAVHSAGVSSKYQHLRSPHPVLVTVEASRAHILVRNFPDCDSAAFQPLQVRVHGTLSRRDVKFVEDVFGWCRRPKSALQRPLETAADISPQVMKELESRHTADPLPSGWYYDGYGSYFDVDGVKSTIRPDIDQLVQAYLTRLNQEILDYNSKLEEVKEFL